MEVALENNVIEELTWENRKEIVSSWPFLGPFHPLMTVFAVYLWLVYKFLPKFMSTRKPYNLTFVIRCYNIFQIVACTMFLKSVHKVGFSFTNAFQCIHSDGEFTKELMEVSTVHWYFIILRMIEFLETIFFLLRKKFDQVTTLHVYHHISTVALLYISVKYSAAMMEVYITAVNSLVHVIMYGYYFFSSFESCKKLTNIIKPYLTSIQIIQLTTILIHCIVAVQPSCRTVHEIFYPQIVNMTLLLTLFIKFYVKSFIKRKQK